jgi:hypothetical protein
MSARRTAVRLLLPALLAGSAACGGGGDGGTGPPPPPTHVNTPDQLMEALRVAWEARNPAMGTILSDTFTFHFPRNDVDFWQLPPTWGRTEELDCVRQLFAGDEGHRPGGAPQSAVDTRFTFGLVLTPVENDWAVTTRKDPPFAGLLSRRYDVIMIAQYVSADFDFVGSRNEFFLAEKDVTLPDGTPSKRWVIQEWRDLGNPDPVFRHGTISWGFFKWMYE